jgi:hypothetical protein
MRRWPPPHAHQANGMRILDGGDSNSFPRFTINVDLSWRLQA